MLGELVTAIIHSIVNAAAHCTGRLAARVTAGLLRPACTITVAHFGRMPNSTELFDLLLDWVPDENTRTRILVDNPAGFYGF